MSHNEFTDSFSAKAAGENHLVPPADGGTIDLRGTDGALVLYNTASSVTGKLPPSMPFGVSVYVSNRSTGTITVQNPSAVTVDTVADGEIKGFISAGDNTWNALGGASDAAIEEAVQELADDLAATTNDHGASLIGLRDTNEYTDRTTVEAALDELYAEILANDTGFIALPLNAWRETTAFDVGNATANGGILASDTTPVLSAINDATNGCQRLLWAASNNDQITQSVVLPADLDRAKQVNFHCRIASGGTTNAVGFTLGSFFDEGDTAVADATTTNQSTAYSESTAVIAAADIPANAQTLTIGLTPVAHTTDTLACTATWITYHKKLLNSEL